MAAKFASHIPSCMSLLATSVVIVGDESFLRTTVEATRTGLK